MEKSKLKQCCNIRVFVLLAVFVFMSKQSFGGGNEFKSPQIVSRPALQVFVGNAFPTNPMLEDMTELKIAPGIFSYSINGKKDDTTCSDTSCNKHIQSEDGMGISLSLVRAFTPNIGIGISGAYVKSDGSIGATTFSTLGFTDSRKYSGPIKETGGVAAAGVILDPFSDPDGLRMPFSLGVSYQTITGAWDVPFTFTAGNSPSTTQVGDRGQDTGDFLISSFGWYAGFSLQFNTGPFKWSPFVFVNDSFSKPEYTWTVTNHTRGTSVTKHQTTSETGLWGFGIPVTFRPLGLTFTYIPDWIEVQNGAKFSSYVMSWSKKW